MLETPVSYARRCQVTPDTAPAQSLLSLLPPGPEEGLSASKEAEAPHRLATASMISFSVGSDDSSNTSPNAGGNGSLRRNSVPPGRCGTSL